MGKKDDLQREIMKSRINMTENSDVVENLKDFHRKRTKNFIQ